jgi:hypothetical protein
MVAAAILPLLKYAAAVILFTAFTAAGVSLNAARRRRIRRVGALCELAGYTRSQIDCFRTPVKSILSSFSSDALSECGFLEKAASGDIDGAAAALGSGEERVLTRDFLARLGRGYASEELRLCDGYAEAIGALYSKLKNDYPAAARVSGAISTLAGICAAIACL